jgi:flagellar biosynthesis/type III secretory pathway chaperone
MDETRNARLDRLIAVIGEEACLFEQFLALLEHQQEMLVKGDRAELQAVNARLQTVIAHSQQMERQRAEAVEAIRTRDGMEADVTIARICDIADTERSSQLRNLREVILGLYSRIEETRMRNGLLVEQSLEQIQHTLEMLGRVPARRETYQQQGRRNEEYVPLGIDRRV